MILTNRKLFLVDGLGALLSFSCLSSIALFFPEWIGLPEKSFLILCIFAFLLSVYSLTMASLKREVSGYFFRILAIANSTYCLVSIYFLVSNWVQITPFGVTYLTLEKLVVGILVYFEIKKGNQN